MNYMSYISYKIRGAGFDPAHGEEEAVPAALDRAPAAEAEQVCMYVCM